MNLPPAPSGSDVRTAAARALAVALVLNALYEFARRKAALYTFDDPSGLSPLTLTLEPLLALIWRLTNRPSIPVEGFVGYLYIGWRAVYAAVAAAVAFSSPFDAEARRMNEELPRELETEPAARAAPDAGKPFSARRALHGLLLLGGGVEAARGALTVYGPESLRYGRLSFLALDGPREGAFMAMLMAAFVAVYGAYSLLLGDVPDDED